MVWLSADWETPSFAAAFGETALLPDGQEGQEVVQISALH